ncbi:MAG: UDP-N-acetylmuramoyl-L-alanine--D-glutamate ligase [Gallionellales bacterium 35-53-114]|jgi:UDP-N-acetylmuramoylalanine--D-glutamate ligase|nr:MAG: UDP-N-acetylmuramoyl-L-alanine--D-glutamate ligase [Gallionellales bacterium 35-53-114]OYZ63916.1 MAG: UDP-N-acetylmuramoyl-L-alanine--D-glutamate ligase [Gallionellales bacterium 24-53-125]HQS59140.1 UDP-N-acetylmuramoyl-L-alanine--D-glutamate ligase [Gallionellaceae bacterium]HQS75876.1 UDP-N-acetylmuramoyl-L-alanine--D-glutamate ligase [Gallionellaceae bacterium]
MNKQWAKKSVLVLGLGETGLSLVRWLSAQGASVRVADSRNNPPSLDVLQKEFPKVDVHCGFFRSELLDGIELIAISPGVPLRDPFVMRAAAQGIPVVGDIELFALSLPQKKCPKIIAISGSNGKTTVTSMVGAMCRATGKETLVAGNISPAVLDVLMQRKGKHPDIWVLELSSFQLETTASLNADAATVLNISEDHMDRYNDMAEYIAAKARIFRANGQGGVQVLNRDDADSAAMALLERRHITFGINTPPVSAEDWGIEMDNADTWLVQGKQRVLKASELQVEGMHNISNALAALALCRAIDLPLPPLLEALRNFKGLPHRVEAVAEIKDVIYYDDSKGTNVGATVAALNGLGRRAVVILGGDGKGQDFSPLEPAVAKHARAVVLIGRDAEKIAAALQTCDVPLLKAADMNDAVMQSAELAQPGDAVLMSPACASFDMYRNYVHRAEVFISAVRALQKEAA